MKEFSNNSGIEDLIKTSVEKVKVLIETNTIVGEPIKISENTVIVPISKASVGFVAGGGEYSDKSNRRVANHFPMTGGSGCGMSVTPIGFVVVNAGNVSFVDVENKSLYQTLLNLADKLVSKIKADENHSNNGDKHDNQK
ncbi:MAG: sporulation protein YtfJ [Clostridia bacterium]|nr:sporulation protein YtfJ [Clostridia bacterium]